jgi:FkbM family methyltransferase
MLTRPPLTLARHGKREKIQRLLRPLFELIGIDSWSWPGLNGLDRKLAHHLTMRNGWFVEAGAYDGFQQSNTYHLERFQGWRGVLIEPLPELAVRCREMRPKSTTICCALGPPELAGKSIKLRHAGLMTMAQGILGNDAMERDRATKGLKIQGMPDEEIVVVSPVRTLTEVLVETGTPTNWDLLSLDVEGMEVEVLRGLDFDRFRPKSLCVEIRHENLSAVSKMLEGFYREPTILAAYQHYSDYYFEIRTQ